MDPLSRDVALLRSKMIAVIAQHESADIAQHVTTLIHLSSKYRQSEDLKDLETLTQVVHATCFLSASSPAGPQSASASFPSSSQSEQSSLLHPQCLQIARAFHELLNLANLCESHHRIRRWKRFQRGEGDVLSKEQSPASAFQRLQQLGFSPAAISAAMAEQRTDFVLTAHPTQATRRTLLSKYAQIANILALRGAQQTCRRQRRSTWTRSWTACCSAAGGPTRCGACAHRPWRRPGPGLAVVEDTLWFAVPRHLRNVDDALIEIGAPPLPPACSPVTFSSWMGGDRDGNPFVTAEVTREVVFLSRWRAADLYYKAVDALMWTLSMTSASADLLQRVHQIQTQAGQLTAADVHDKTARYFADYHPSDRSREYRQDSALTDEPYRIVLAHLREKLFVTRKYLEYAVNGDLPRASAYIKKRSRLLVKTRADLQTDLLTCYSSLLAVCNDELIAEGALKDLLRNISCFGMSLVKLDVRQESERHRDCMEAITQYLQLGSYRDWSEDDKCAFLVQELNSHRPLIRWPLFFASPQCTDEVREVMLTFKMVFEVGPEYLGAYVISMASFASDVLIVSLLQKEAGLSRPLRVVPLFEMERDLKTAAATIDRLFSTPAYKQRINGHQEVMLGYRSAPLSSARTASPSAAFAR